MRTTYVTPRRILVALAVLLTSSTAYADSVTVTGTNITLMSGTGNLTVFDSSANSGSAIKSQNNSPGSMGQFDPSLGVLTDATGTLTIVAATLTRGGSGGSAGFSYQWWLGGNPMSKSTSTTGTSLSLTTPTFGSLAVISSAANLNNFVGLGNIGQNYTNTQLSAYRTGPTLSGTSASVNPNPVLASESIVYTYRTHSNASFASGGDLNALTLDFGQLAFGASYNEDFNISNLGSLGLTNFALSFLTGDNLFNITGGNVAAGGSGLYNASFAGQTPLALTNYAGTYRLTFTDNVSGLSQYASSSVGTNYIDITLQASVAPVPVPLPAAVWSGGIILCGLAAGKLRRRRTARQEL